MYSYHCQWRNHVALLPKPSILVTPVGGLPLGSCSVCCFAGIFFKRSGFHGLLLPVSSCLTVSCNSNHCVTSIAVTPSPFPQCHLIGSSHPFLPAGPLGGGSRSRKGHVRKKMVGGKSRVSWQGSFSPCLKEQCLHFTPFRFSYFSAFSCMPSMFSYAIETPKEAKGIRTMVIHLFSKHLLCGRQPGNWKWVLWPQGTCHIEGEIKHVNKLVPS